MLKNPPAVQETRVWSLSWEDSLEKGMATHSSILAWRIPWTEEPGGLGSMGSRRVGHNWATNTFPFTLLAATLSICFPFNKTLKCTLSVHAVSNPSLPILFGISSNQLFIASVMIPCEVHAVNFDSQTSVSTADLSLLPKTLSPLGFQGSTRSHCRALSLAAPSVFSANSSSEDPVSQGWVLTTISLLLLYPQMILSSL